MSTFSGKDGVIKSGSNAVAEVRSWSIEETAGTTNDTVMGDDWDTHKVTQKSWSGSCDVYFDDTDADGQATFVAGASVTVHFQMEGDTSGDHDFTGTVTITSRSVSSSHDGIIEASFSFTGNGALTESTVA
tara:strand:- start:2974 stop:3366 length:393 start_codon:yes stop_codon:yes gene_type:complete